ncbi:Bestrophin, RFP-TM, chloride channel-domain-containing protein [Phaeosphaeria sp. MPI-PUGE-AT-0046c]|nr:Bestrophin, RFP-TM, chloride channel-domain-containing protein [Phaeosphaeria sp. MPI-PUGE-AT-0046c]
MSWAKVKNVEEQTSQKSKQRRGLQEYFVGPRDVTRHSKWPRALRMHGSVTPKILLRTILVGIWATVITTISQRVHQIDIHPIIATVLGILVGFALNLRSNTAYERYMEGRKVWSRLNIVSSTLARNIWCHAKEREGELGKQDLLAKVSFLNLLVAFAVSLKHKLRFEPYTQYDDLEDLVSHLDTFARSAGTPNRTLNEITTWRKVKFLLRLAEPNPRAELKQAKRSLGNLPLEILGYMNAYVQTIVDNGTFPLASTQSKAIHNIESLDDILVTADRILNTPLPIAYTIAISQITWIYVITLPVQLVKQLGWINVPVTLISAYIILGFAAIGNEIENPFGIEVNDLPLELYCGQIASDIAIISSKPPPGLDEYAFHSDNKPLYPMSSAGPNFWPDADVKDLREALRTRAMMSKPAMWRRQSSTLKAPLVRGQSVGGSTLNETEQDNCRTTGVSAENTVRWAV